MPSGLIFTCVGRQGRTNQLLREASDEALHIKDHRMDKRKFSVYYLRINALVLRSKSIKTAIGLVMHDFHGLKTMTFTTLQALLMSGLKLQK